MAMLLGAAMTLAKQLSLKSIVTPQWVATPFSSDSIDFNEIYIASVIAALMPTSE